MGTKRPYVRFEEIKSKISIPMLLEKCGILDQFTDRKGVLSGVCPVRSHIHGPDPNSNQFKADARRGEWLWKCFGCNSGGDVINLAKGINDLDDAHVRLWFAQNFGDVLTLIKPKAARTVSAGDRGPDDKPETAERVSSSAPPDNRQPKADGLKPLSFYLQTDLDAAMPYLEQRGISRDMAERYGVGFYGKPNKMFSGYVVAPCYRFPKESEKECPIGYIGRWPGSDFDDVHPKYKAGFETGNIVYGMEIARASSASDDPLIVVEGPLTVLWMADRGYSNTVSTFTSSVSDTQAKILADAERSIVLAFDGDVAGQNGMRNAAAKLIKHVFVHVVALPDGAEPDQFDANELARYFEQFKPR